MKAFLQRHRRILGEAGWVFAGQGAAALATLVGLRLITEIVPPAVYGTVALALGAVALAQGLAVGPLMQAVLRYYPERVGHDGEQELRRAALGALRRPLLVSTAGLAALAIAWAVADPRQLWLVLLTVALFLVETARSIEITFLNAARRQRAMALLVIADAWARPLFAVATVWAWGTHAAAVMAGYLLGAGLSIAAYWAVLRRLPKLFLSADATSQTELMQKLRAYAKPLAALPLIGWINGQADRYILAGLASVANAGQYAALYGLASKPFLLLSASLDLALRQPFYGRVSANDHRGARGALGLWLGGVLAGAQLIAFAFLVFHAEIISLLLASEYREHSALMGWIAVGHVLLLAAQVFERACYAYHDTRGVLIVEVTGAILSVAIAAPLIWRYGIEGAAWAVPAYFGAQLLLALARARVVWRRTHEGATRPDPTPAAKQIRL